MAYQTAANILVALRRETTTGTAAGATASLASVLRIIESPGLTYKRAPVQSAELRADGFAGMARLGGASVDGSYNCELSVGGAHDILLESVVRGAWATATAITFATMTSVTTGTNEVVAAGGSWLTQGIKVGDIFHLSNHGTAANNGKNFQVVAVTTLTIVVPSGSLTADATADATGTLTVLSKLIGGTTPTRYSHSVEQYDVDTDLSELFLGVRCVGAHLSGKPGEMAKVSYTFQGMDRTALATNTSPYFTTPVTTTSLALVADDSSILYNGSQVATLTGFDLDLALAAAATPVIGSRVVPDIFDNTCTLTGTVTGIRTGFGNVTLFDDETEFTVAIRLQEPVVTAGTPPACLAVTVPRVKIAALSAPVGGGTGAKIETMELAVGPMASAAGYDATPVVFHSSATH